MLVRSGYVDPELDTIVPAAITALLLVGDPVIDHTSAGAQPLHFAGPHATHVFKAVLVLRETVQ
jgi:hypothetical protein